MFRRTTCGWAAGGCARLVGCGVALLTLHHQAEIEQALAANMELAQALGITGTPGFVVGKQMAPGAIDYDTLKRFVAEARKGS